MQTLGECLVFQKGGWVARRVERVPLVEMLARPSRREMSRVNSRFVFQSTCGEKRIQGHAAGVPAACLEG